MSAPRPTMCVVNPYEHGGGAEYQMSLLIDALIDEGRYDVHFLTHFVDSRERTRNYTVNRIGSSRDIPRLGYLMDAPSLYGTLRDINPEVIYQRVACGYTGICALFSLRRSIPLIWHVAHDTDVSRAALDPARNFLRLGLEKAALGFGARRATAVICQTQHQADLLEMNYQRPAAAVIPNFHPPAVDAIDKSGPVTVIWIANLKPWKRPDAFVRLAQEFKGTAVRFVMVGATAAGPGNRRWLQELMQSIEACENLRYLGHKNHSEVNALLARAHIFVNTSQHEGFPNTFIQAWQRDVTVVSLSVDPDNVLSEKHVGILARSEEGLSAAVRLLSDDPGVREAYATRGRAHALAHHSLDNARRLARLIERYGGRGG